MKVAALLVKVPSIVNTSLRVPDKTTVTVCSDFNNRVSLHTLKQKAKYMKGPHPAGKGWAHPPQMAAGPLVLWWLLEIGQAVLQPAESCCSWWIGGANLPLPKRPLCPDVLGFNWLVHTFSSRLRLLTLPPHPAPSPWFTVSTGLKCFSSFTDSPPPQQLHDWVDCWGWHAGSC